MESGIYTVEVVDVLSYTDKNYKHRILKLEVFSTDDNTQYVYVSTANTKLFIKMMSITFTVAFVKTHSLMAHLDIAALFMFGKKFTADIREDIRRDYYEQERRTFYVRDVWE
jgi:hypothetical protein